MKIDSEDFRVREGDSVNLRKWPNQCEADLQLQGEAIARFSQSTSRDLSE